MNPHPAISDTARAVLVAAAERADHRAVPPDRLPIAARRSVVHSLLKAGLIEEAAAADAAEPGWRTDDRGGQIGLRLTAAGLQAVADAPADPSMGDTVQPGWDKTDAPGNQISDGCDAPTVSVSGRQIVREAAQQVLAAWDDTDPTRPDMDHVIAALRAALTPARAERRSSAAPRQPRPNTKRAQVLALLRRADGATVAQVVEATGWATHTVRGFLASLKKAGTPIEVLSRVRQVGPGKEGAKGSYTVYCIADAG